MLPWRSPGRWPSGWRCAVGADGSLELEAFWRGRPCVVTIRVHPEQVDFQVGEDVLEVPLAAWRDALGRLVDILR